MTAAQLTGVQAAAAEREVLYRGVLDYVAIGALEKRM